MVNLYILQLIIVIETIFEFNFYQFTIYDRTLNVKTKILILRVISIFFQVIVLYNHIYNAVLAASGFYAVVLCNINIHPHVAKIGHKTFYVCQFTTNVRFNLPLVPFIFYIYLIVDLDLAIVMENWWEVL